MARALRSEDGAKVYVWFSFNRRIVDDLKDYIPPWARRWDPDRRCWEVDDVWWDEAREILATHGVDIKIDSDPFGTWTRPPRGSSTPTPPPGVTRIPLDTDLRVLFLLPGAPPEVIRAAYRALSLLYHPDRGGDAQCMKRLNQAYENLEKKGLVH